MNVGRISFKYSLDHYIGSPDDKRVSGYAHAAGHHLPCLKMISARRGRAQCNSRSGYTGGRRSGSDTISVIGDRYRIGISRDILIGRRNSNRTSRHCKGCRRCRLTARGKDQIVCARPFLESLALFRFIRRNRNASPSRVAAAAGAVYDRDGVSGGPSTSTSTSTSTVGLIAVCQRISGEQI